MTAAAIVRACAPLLLMVPAPGLASQPAAAPRGDRNVLVSPLVSTGASPDGVVTLALDASMYSAAKKLAEARFTGLRVGPDISLDLDVTRFDVLEDDARVVAVTERGEVEVARPDVQLWRGRVVGDPDSRVYLGLSARGSVGFVVTAGRTYVVSSGVAGNLPTVAYDTLCPGAPSGDAAPLCAGEQIVPGTTPVFTDPGPGASRGGRSWECRAIRLAIDCDNEFTNVTFGGSVEDATAYATLLSGAVSEIYTADMNIALRVIYLRCWVAADPYTQASAGDQLNEFRNYWNANMGGVNRSIAHLLSARGLGGGVAWLQVACNSSYGYAVSGNIAGHFPYPISQHNTNNWDLMVMAHEIGHNLGSGHTHDPGSYNPIIDGCGSSPQDCTNAWNISSIMSYCHLCPLGMRTVNMNFGPRPSEAIRTYLDNSAPSCGGYPTVTITSNPSSATLAPGGNAAFTGAASATGGGAVVTYRWYKDGVALSDGANGAGTVVAGATSGTLQLTGLHSSDAGWYSVLAKNSCASASSAEALLRCPSDFNADGFTTGEDFDAFVALFVDGDATADFDANGFVNGDDFDEFSGAFTAGC